MEKIIVIGCPGSGKSTFARALHQITGIPLCHLDRLFWNPDKTTVEKSVFLQRLSQVLQTDRWIIDGNYASTMALRMQACDTVIFLDYPLAVCLAGIRERKGKVRSDMPWVEDETDDPEFLALIQNYNTQSRPQVMTLLEQHADKKIHIFQSRAEAEKFLQKQRLFRK